MRNAVIPGPAEGRSPESIITVLTCNAGIEIGPSGVGPFDQVDLPFATPLFEFLLASNRIEDVIVALEPNKNMNPVSRCEPTDCMGLVFICATDQVIGNAEIERPMLSTCDDVDVVHNCLACGLWIPGSRLRRAPE